MKLFLLLAAVPLLAQTGAIDVAAFNSLTKAPVAGMKILVVSPTDTGVRFEGVTDALGVSRFEAVPAGVYFRSLTIPQGFYSPEWTQARRQDLRIEVKDGATTKLEIALSPQAVIRGRVLDPDGKPVARATLVATPLTGFGMGMGLTDAEGRFAVRIPAGRFRLQVRPRSETWAVAEYPAPLDVTEGADLAGYDIRLRPAEGHQLRGVVHDSAGKPVPGARVTLGEKKGTSDDRGAFEFPLVPAGDWRITAKIGVHEIEWQGSTVLAMPNRDYDRADIRIDPPFGLDVMLDGAPKDHRQLRFTLVPPDNPPFPPAATERGGAARFEPLYPGRYRLGVQGSIPGHYVKAVIYGGTDVTGQPLDLGPASPELKVVYAPNGGRVRGEVEDGAGVQVVLIWADRENYIPGADVFVQNSDDRGNFGGRDLRPGDWYAVAIRSGGFLDLDNLRHRIFDLGMWREAASVKVAEGETATVKLSITNF
jgi:hypothetical protein